MFMATGVIAWSFPASTVLPTRYAQQKTGLARATQDIRTSLATEVYASPQAVAVTGEELPVLTATLMLPVMTDFAHAPRDLRIFLVMGAFVLWFLGDPSTPLLLLKLQ